MSNKEDTVSSQNAQLSSLDGSSSVEQGKQPVVGYMRPDIQAPGAVAMSGKVGSPNDRGQIEADKALLYSTVVSGQVVGSLQRASAKNRMAAAAHSSLASDDRPTASQVAETVTPGEISVLAADDAASDGSNTHALSLGQARGTDTESRHEKKQVTGKGSEPQSTGSREPWALPLSPQPTGVAARLDKGHVSEPVLGDDLFRRVLKSGKVIETKRDVSIHGPRVTGTSRDHTGLDVRSKSKETEVKTKGFYGGGDDDMSSSTSRNPTQRVRLRARSLLGTEPREAERQQGLERPSRTRAKERVQPEIEMSRTQAENLRKAYVRASREISESVERTRPVAPPAVNTRDVMPRERYPRQVSPAVEVYREERRGKPIVDNPRRVPPYREVSTRTEPRVSTRREDIVKASLVPQKNPESVESSSLTTTQASSSALSENVLFDEVDRLGSVSVDPRDPYFVPDTPPKNGPTHRRPNRVETWVSDQSRHTERREDSPYRYGAAMRIGKEFPRTPHKRKRDPPLPRTERDGKSPALRHLSLAYENPEYRERAPSAAPSTVISRSQVQSCLKGVERTWEEKFEVMKQNNEELIKNLNAAHEASVKKLIDQLRAEPRSRAASVASSRGRTSSTVTTVRARSTRSVPPAPGLDPPRGDTGYSSGGISTGEETGPQRCAEFPETEVSSRTMGRGVTPRHACGPRGPGPIGDPQTRTESRVYVKTETPGVGYSSDSTVGPAVTGTHANLDEGAGTQGTGWVSAPPPYGSQPMGSGRVAAPSMPPYLHERAPQAPLLPDTGWYPPPAPNRRPDAPEPPLGWSTTSSNASVVEERPREPPTVPVTSASLRGPKLREFDGQSETWDSYYHHFRFVKRLHGWSEELSVQQLCVNLKGQAMEFYAALPEERQEDYDFLMRVMRERFASISSLQDARRQLEQLHQKPGQKLEELAELVSKFTSILYAGTTQDFWRREQDAIQYFTRAMSDSDMAGHVRLQNCKNLQEATAVAKNYADTFWDLGKNRSRGVRSASVVQDHVEGQEVGQGSVQETRYVGPAQNQSGSGQPTSYNAQGRGQGRGQSQNQNQGNRQGRAPNRGNCFLCGEPGHFARECPKHPNKWSQEMQNLYNRQTTGTTGQSQSQGPQPYEQGGPGPQPYVQGGPQAQGQNTANVPQGQAPVSQVQKKKKPKGRRHYSGQSQAGATNVQGEARASASADTCSQLAGTGTQGAAQFVSTGAATQSGNQGNCR